MSFDFRPHHLDDFFFPASFVNLLHHHLHQRNETTKLLFVGPPSSGKSELISVLLHQFFHIADNETQQVVSANIADTEIMMIDSLKEQGVHFFRNELKLFCQTKPHSTNNKKWVLIDGVDQLTEQCQQIFRNYMDSYSKNVHFISSCTTVENVLESFQSRVTILRIPEINKDRMTKLFDKICAVNNMWFDMDAKEYLFRYSIGSFKTLINNMEKSYMILFETQCQENETLDPQKTDALPQTSKMVVNLETCKIVCNSVSFDVFEEYLQMYEQNGKWTNSVAILYDLYYRGFSVIDIFDMFFQFIKKHYLFPDTWYYTATSILCKYITFFNKYHENPIELMLFTYEMSNSRPHVQPEDPTTSSKSIGLEVVKQQSNKNIVVKSTKSTKESTIVKDQKKQPTSKPSKSKGLSKKGAGTET